VALIVTAAPSILPFDQTFAFRAYGRLASGDTASVAVSWVATGGQIASDGRYRGTAPGSHTVTAYAVGSPSLSGSARIDVSDPGPLFETLDVQPKPVYISGGAHVLFGATARLQSGANTLPTVTWRATGGGAIGASGEFAAGLIPGSYAVIATTLDGLLSDTALVVVEPAEMTAIQLQPRVVTIPGGSTQEFEVVTTWTDGSDVIPELEWITAAGTVEMIAGGSGAEASPGESRLARFIASRLPGTHRLVVRHPESGKSDTASVTITPVLDAVEVTPAAVTLLPGVTAAFSAKGRMTDGVQTNLSVSWAATGGTISGSGVYTAGGTAGTFRVIGRLASGTLADTSVVTISAPAAATLTRISLSPATGTAPIGQTVEFTAGAIWSNGSTALPALHWSAQAGSVTPEGIWTAPATAGSYRIIARHSGGTLADTAVFAVVVPPAGLTALTVTPESPAVQGGQSVDFQAQATWSDGSAALPALTWSTTGGVVSSTGRWTSPNVSGVYRVVARANTAAIADTAVVTVSETPRVTSIRVSPRLGALNPGGTVQLSSEITWSDGQQRAVTRTFSASGGTVSMSGLYTAGALAGQVLVIASCGGCSVSDTARFTITAPVVPAPVVTSLNLNPSSFSTGAGEGRELNISATWDDGSTTVPPLVWSATGGTMVGLTYVAGTTAGTFRIIAKHAGSTVADTTAATITGGSTPATLSSLNLNPSSVSLAPGAQRTMTVGASWSDGSTMVPPLAWTATGGTMNGLVYTAGAATGSYRIIATQQGGGLADTTVVTIQAGAPATLVTLGITPPSASVSAGASLQFAATGLWSDSSTAAPQVTWTATGGTISGTGFFVAGGTSGTFQVTATHAASGLTATRSVSITPSAPSLVALPEAPRVFINSTYQVPTGAIRRVAAGANLQSVLNAAQCGDRILLASGATFTGNFTLPAKSCTNSWIELSTETSLPPEGSRVTPATATGYAHIVTALPNAPALTTAPGANNYRIMGVEFGVAPNITLMSSIVELNVNNLTNVSQLPRDIVLDRVVITGHNQVHVRRCLLMNAIRVALVDSYLAGCHYKGADAQAVLLWNTPGPIKVVNNYLEGSGENMMIGGADPSINGMVPADIEIRRNYFFKPPAWYASNQWSVKNALELKIGKRVMIEGNIMENNWVDAQTGFSIVFKSVNQSGSAPWSETSDVMFRNNIIVDAPNAISMSGKPEQYPAIRMSRIAVVNNLMYKIGPSGSFGGAARGFQFSSDMVDVTVLNNTVLGTTMNGFILTGTPAIGTLDLRNNIIQGWLTSADGVGRGATALNYHQTQWTMLGNVMAYSPASVFADHPAGNFYTTTVGNIGFLDLSSWNVSLAGSSPFKGKGTEGRDPGVDLAAVLAATSGVR